MPDVLVTVAAVIVGVAFTVAGGTKLAARNRWVEQAAGLGVARPIALTVPWVELIIGVGLIVQLGRRPLAAAALLLLLAFTALLAWHMVRGRRPPCACFGALSAEPIGMVHLVRNGVLIALAAIALG